LARNIAALGASRSDSVREEIWSEEQGVAIYRLHLQGAIAAKEKAGFRPSIAIERQGTHPPAAALDSLLSEQFSDPFQPETVERVERFALSRYFSV
jgi:hypothetical protein